MLLIKNIVKDYPLKGQEAVNALKGISISFRSNEFVAVLGPSGCGKTTMLNIIGGLDRYTSGDLVIDGISTRDFTDLNWDTYRNHSIGFVFQSYNLINHQSVLKNVELALTISGVSKEERRHRAMQALEKVGLKGQEKKKPTMLSGGQMQRVAIARALVNNPEILLADEPTGALDSTTSIQIMDLLKEVAKDRLVIMVTHNPDLAYQYANRIVKLFDGNIIDDSNPYRPTHEEIEMAKANSKVNDANKGKKKQTSMSFKTALGLSFANLISKSKRTILVAVAGSIGIIGVSSVLAVSTGVKNYIANMQDDMLSSYPIEIAEESVDYTSLMAGLSTEEKVELAKQDNKIGVDSLLTYLIEKYEDVTSVKTNTIDQKLIDFISEIPEEHLSAMNFNYSIDPTNNIYTDWKRSDGSSDVSMSLNGLTQMYIAELKTVEGYKEYAQYVDLFTDFMKQLPAEEEYILSQFNLLKGTYPKKADEMLLVVDKNQTETDILMAQLGFYNQDQFLNIAQRALEETKEKPDPAVLEKLDYPHYFDFDEVLNKKFVYYPHQTIWTYDSSIKINYQGMEVNYPMYNYPAKADSSWSNGKEMKIVGIVQAKDTTNFGTLSRGIYYTKEFTDLYINDACSSDIINNDTNGIKSYIGSSKEEQLPFMAYVYYDYTSFVDSDHPVENVRGSASALNADLTSTISSLFSGMTGQIDYTELDLTYLRSLCGLKGKRNADTNKYEYNKFPQMISIYPKDFDHKEKVLDYLDQWNKEGVDLTVKGTVYKFDDRDELTYTDTLSIIISVINTLIDAITIALVSFTSLSLVVSCFMIAVITYISVMERVKEIGVIRSLGGRKKDVSRLFIAETFIIGTASGIIGVGITYVLCAILNIAVAKFKVGRMGDLTPTTALIMIALSFFLTVISGLIPSQKASHQDPVIALRSE